MADTTYQYLDSTGVIVPDTADIQAGVIAEYQGVFGPTINTDPSTPQGALIVSETLARTEVVKNNAAVANQINPNIAGGVFLNAICALTGFDVPGATFSTIAGVALAGVAGTIVTAGQVASVGIGGPQFASVSTVTLDGSGNATVDFEAVEAGPIAAPATDLDTLVAPVLGLETVINANAAVLGVAGLSDTATRALRDNTLALQGESLVEAITSALYDPAQGNVRSLKFRENITKIDATIDGIFLVANSIWACCQGGTDSDIAMALLGSKTLGADWNGMTSVTIVEPASGQSYTVLFDRPTAVPIFVRITVNSLSSLADIPTSVANAVVAYAAGAVDGQPGFVVGANASPFSIAAGVAAQIPGLFIPKCEVSPDGSSWQTTEIDIALNEAATTEFSSVTVVIGT